MTVFSRHVFLSDAVTQEIMSFQNWRQHSVVVLLQDLPLVVFQLATKQGIFFFFICQDFLVQKFFDKVNRRPLEEVAT